MIRVVRMCGGGTPVFRRRFWWRYPGYRLTWGKFGLRWTFDRKGLVSDWLGWGVFWGPKR